MTHLLVIMEILQKKGVENVLVVNLETKDLKNLVKNMVYLYPQSQTKAQK